MTFVDALTASPLLYPLAIDVRSDSVRLIRLTAAEYAAASFLDDRLLTPSTQTASVPWTDVRAATENLPAQCHFIFHISHVGSTLLSRLVGEHQELFSLREPAILRFLANCYLSLDDPQPTWNRPEFGDRHRRYLALWSRTFDASQTAVVKATSFVCEMADHLLDRVGSARAVFMFVTPEIFLQALLGGSMSDIESGAEKRLVRLHRRLGESSWRLVDLSPGERVAMSWLSEMTALHAAAERFSERVMWLNFDDFLVGPEEKLAAVLDHFGVADEASAAKTILAGPTMHHYAKAPAHRFDGGTRRQLLEQAARQYAAEIANGLSWLERAATRQPVQKVIERFASASGSNRSC